MEQTPGKGKRNRTLEKVLTANVRDIAKAYTEVMLAELIKLATKSKSENMRLLAANSVLERGWGKPAQAHVGGDEGDNPIRHVHEVVRKVIDPKARSE
jgi:hypothetical protein